MVTKLQSTIIACQLYNIEKKLTETTPETTININRLNTIDVSSFILHLIDLSRLSYINLSSYRTPNIDNDVLDNFSEPDSPEEHHNEMQAGPHSEAKIDEASPESDASESFDEVDDDLQNEPLSEPFD